MWLVADHDRVDHRHCLEIDDRHRVVAAVADISRATIGRQTDPVREIAHLDLVDDRSRLGIHHREFVRRFTDDIELSAVRAHREIERRLVLDRGGLSLSHVGP